MSDGKTFTITLTDIHTPPSISPISNQAADPGTLLFLSITASDNDVPAQSFRLRAGIRTGRSDG